MPSHRHALAPEGTGSWLLLATLLLFLQGCATVTRGSSQKVLISSAPTGAVLTVDGVEQGTTPAVVSLTRRVPHTLGVVVEGYAPETRVVSPSASYSLIALNLLLFHPVVAAVGVSVDLMTGAYRRFTPESVGFRLAIRDTVALARPTHIDVAWAPVPIGSRIRVSRADHSAPATVGTLLAFSGDTLLLESAVPGAFHRIPRGSVGSIELSLGPNRPKGLLRWAGRGALGGLAAGALWGSSGGEGGAILFGGLGGLCGLALGTVAGVVIPQPDRWLRIR